MVRYHSGAWFPETTVGGNGWEPGWYQYRERETVYVWAKHKREIAGGCDGCLWPRGEISLSHPENDNNNAIPKINNKLPSDG